MKRCRFAVGQVVTHALLRYRGVIVSVDAEWRAEGDWFDAVARARPPSGERWYRVRMDGSQQEAYVAEASLRACDDAVAVLRPLRDEAPKAAERLHVG
jgi:heat shock protein HspQ